MALPLVTDAATAMVPRPGGDDAGSQELGAAVVLTLAGADLLRHHGPFRLGRHLRSLLAEHLDPSACPRRWRFAEALPASSLGKRSDAAVAALFKAPDDV